MANITWPKMNERGQMTWPKQLADNVRTRPERKWPKQPKNKCMNMAKTTVAQRNVRTWPKCKTGQNNVFKNVRMWPNQIWPKLATQCNSQSSMNYTPYAKQNTIANHKAKRKKHKKAGSLCRCPAIMRLQHPYKMKLK